VPERIDGIGLMESLLALSAQRGYRPYLLGARADVLATCVERIRNRFPTIQLAGFRNGYFDALDLPGIVRDVNATRPDILFLGLGSPMKERLADEWRKGIDAPVIQGVGGSFDVLAGLVPRAPVWMQRSGLEWSFRVLQEPRRMFWRYLKTNSKCMWLFARALARRSIGVGPNPA
jgi:N-acetylglucosaminyldiphosphoundecaprenol N-acetyl-beta-D-mannosaminyltransferase